MKVHLGIQEIVGWDSAHVLAHGIPAYAFNTVNELLKRSSFDYELGFFDYQGANGNRLRAEQIFGKYASRFRECNEIKSPLNGVLENRVAAFQNKSYSEYMKSDADVFWFPSFYNMPLKNTGKSVVTLHDLSPKVHHYFWGDHLIPTFDYFLKYLETDTDVIIVTDSNSSKNDLLQTINIKEERVHVIYPTDDSSQLFPDFSSRKAVNKFNIGESYMLVLGRVEGKKNVLRILEAFNKISDNYSATQLVFAGVPPLKAFAPEFAKVLANVKNPERIILCGVVTADEKRELLSHAKCLCFPSITEGFGYPIVEAMRCGCPVITSDDTSCPEVAGGAAILVNSQKTDEIADAMEYVLSSQSVRRELRSKGFERVKFFTVDKSINKLEDLFKLAGGQS